MIYINLNSVETNINRVRQRVQNGGHNVPPSDIRRRYERSINNLPKALEIANKAAIYDNSTEIGHREILLLVNNQIVQSSKDMPQWVTQSVPQELFNSYSNRLNIALQIYPTINQVKGILNDRLIEVNSNVQKLEGNKYNVVINNSAQELTLSAKDSRGDLFIYNQSSNEMIFVSAINDTDKNTWMAISDELNQRINKRDIEI